MDYVAERKLIAPASRVDVVSQPPGADRAEGPRAGADDRARLRARRARSATADAWPSPIRPTCRPGRYGKAALTTSASGTAVASRLAPADNVRAALAFVARGEAPLGIVYQSDVVAEPGVTRRRHVSGGHAPARSAIRRR